MCISDFPFCGRVFKKNNIFFSLCDIIELQKLMGKSEKTRESCENTLLLLVFLSFLVLTNVHSCFYKWMEVQKCFRFVNCRNYCSVYQFYNKAFRQGKVGTGIYARHTPACSTCLTLPTCQEQTVHLKLTLLCASLQIHFLFHPVPHWCNGKWS